MSAKLSSSSIIKHKNLILLLIVFLAGVFQSAGLLTVFGVKPNLLLVVLIAEAFFSDFAFYIFLTLASVFALRFRFAFELESLIFAGIALTAYAFWRRLPGQPLLNNLLIVGLGSIVFNLVSSPAFFIGNPILVAGELVYNLISGVLVFKILESWLKTN